MAKREKTDLGGFDDFDLEDNWGLDDFDGQVQDGKNDRNPVRRAGKTVLREMGRTTFSSQMAKAILKEAMPRSFSTTLENLDRGLVDSRALFQDVKKDAMPMVREMRALGRTINRLVPTKYQGKINNLLSSNKDALAGQFQQTDLEDVAVQKALGEVFSADQKDPTQKDLVEKLTEQEYRKKLGVAVMSIQDLLAKQTSYQFGVQRAFQKKSMEIQIRQLMISRSTLDVTRRAAVETSNLLRSIVENTGLPDVVKQHRSEEFWRMGRERVFGKMQQSMADWTANYRKSVGDRIKNVARERFDQLSTGFSLANSSLEELEAQRELLASMGISPSEFMAGAAGNQGALFLGRRAGKWINRKLPALRRTDGTFQGLNYLFNNKERLLAEYGKSGYKYGKWHNPLENFLKDTLRSTYKDGGVVRSGGLANGGLKEMSLEDRKLSYMEEMSGYLSRILHSIDILRTGNPNTERTVFNRQKGIFTGYGESVKDTRNALLSDGQIAQQRENVERLLSSIDPSGRIAGPAKEKVIAALMKRVRTSKAFNPAQMANEGISGLSKDENRLWQGLLAKRYGLKLNEKSEWSLDPFSSSNVNLNLDAGQYNYTSNQTVGLFNKAHALTQTGNLEQLITEGAVVFKNGNWELNPDYYGNRVSGKNSGPGNGPGPDLSTGPNPGPGPNPPPGPGPQPGPGNSSSITDQLRRFGNDWNNPNSVNFNLNRNQGGSTAGFKDALTEQTDRIIANLEKNQAFLQEILPTINQQVAILPDAIAALGALGGGQGGGGNGGGPNPPRTRWWDLTTRGVGRALRGTAKAWWKVSGLPFTIARKALGAARAPFASLMSGAFARSLGGVMSLGQQLGERAQDGYIVTATGLKKVITKEGLLARQYVDQASGKVIKRLSDIKGAVWDSVAQTQVLTDDEAKGGLFNAAGQRIKTSLGSLTRLAGGVLGAAFSPFRMIRGASNLVSKTLGMLLNKLPDVYVAGESTPRLFASKLVRGEYFQMSTGRVVRSLKDLVGDIGVMDPVTRQLTPVLSANEILRGLMDRKGKLLQSGAGKVLGFGANLLKGAGSLMLAPFRIGARMGKFATDMVGGGLRGIGGLLGMGGDRTTRGDKDNNWTRRIYRLLVNQFTGKDPLDGLSEEGSAGRSILGWLKRTKNRVADRANDSVNRLKDRAGSWWNRLHSGKGHDPKPHEADKAAKEGGGWGKMIWLAITAVGGLVGKAVSGFGNFWKWIRDLPRWLGAGRAAGAAGDLLGGGRGRGGLLRRGGRLLKGAGKGLLGAAGWLGRGLLSSAGTVGRMALGVASAAAGAISAPVIIGMAAAAGLGFLIYKGYQAYKNRMNSLREYRAAQYGVSPKDKDKAGKVLALEEAIMKVTQVDGSGRVRIGELNYGELIQAFDIQMTDQKGVLNWTRWFRMRFTPVFARNVEILHRMDNKAKITDATFLKEGQRPDFARQTFIASSNNQSPYLVGDSPFVGDTSIVGDRFVAGYRDVVIREYKKAEDLSRARGETKVVTLGETKQPGVAEQINQKANRLQQTPNRKIDPATDLYYSPGDKIGTPGGITGDVQRDELIQIGNRIDDMTAVRMKLYGLSELVKDDVNTLITLEADVMKSIRFQSNGAATFTGTSGDFFNRWFGHFALNANNPNEKTQWLTWFDQRFMPVFLNFCAQSNKIAPNASPLTAWKRLTSSDLLKIANFANQASTEVNGKRISVWAIRAFPWPKRVANTDGSVISTNLDNLRAQAKKEVYAEKVKTQAELDKMTFDGKALKATLTGTKINDLLADTAALTAGSKGRARGPNGVGSYGQRASTMGTSFEMSGAGADFINENILHTGDGTGGNINDLPVPKGDGWANVKDLIAGVSKMTGVDPGSLAAMIAQESNFALNAANSQSSARGLGQFIKGTWDGILPTLVKKYGVNPNTDRSDPRASVLATAEYMKQNAAIIGDIGRPLTTTDIYMAHFLGPGDAKKVLSVSPDTPIQDALGQRYRGVAAANKSIFDQVSTTGDLSRVLGQYLANKGGSFIDEANSLTNQLGGGGGVIPATPSTPALPTTSPEATESTPSTTPANSKAALPTGSTTSGAIYNRGTDTAPVAVSRGADNRDSAAESIAQERAMNTQASARRAVAERRQAIEKDNKEASNWMNTLSEQLETQRSIDTTLKAIKTVLEGGGGNAASPKATREEGELNGTKTVTPASMQRKETSLPFDTSISNKYRN